MRYAEALAEGQPWRYVPGDPPSTGATSLLWPMLLAPAAALGVRGMSLWAVAVAISALAFAAALVWTARWVSDVSDRTTGWIAAAALASTGGLVWGVASGMEVALFAATLSVTLRWAVDDDAPVWKGRLALGVLAVTRPEGALFAGSVALWRALRALRPGAPAAPNAAATSPPRARLLAAGGWLLVAAAGAIQPVAHLVLHGQMVGSSVLAKQIRWPALDGAARVAFIVSGVLLDGWGRQLGDGLGAVALALAALGAARLVRAPATRALGAFALAAVLLPALVVGMTTSVLVHHARYLQPFLVAFVPLSVLGARALGEVLAARTPIPWASHASLALMLLLGVAPRLASLPDWARTYTRDAHAMAWHDGWAADELAARMNADEVVAVNDVGAIGALSGRRILDLEGIATERALPWAAEGEGAVVAFLAKERPAWAAVFPAWFPALTQGGVFQRVAAHEVPRGSISGAGTMWVARVDLTRVDAAAGVPALAPGERVLDTLDLADLDDEAAHAFRWTGRSPRRATALKLGRDARGDEILDGARRLTASASFTLSDRLPDAPSRLVLRVFGAGERLRVRHEGGQVDLRLPATPATGFAELTVPLSTPAATFVLEPLEGAPLVARAWRVR